MFGTAQEGTDALKAFFFGGDPGVQSASQSEVSDAEGGEGSIFDYDAPQHLSESPAQHSPLPIGHLDLSSSSSNNTPPQLAYERQSSFVQPRPKPTPQHTSTLLALLTDKNPQPSPPPPTKLPTGKRRTSGRQPKSPQEGPREGAGLLDILNGRPPLPSSSSSTSATTLHGQGHHDPSILFANSAPPAEAAGFFDPSSPHVLTDAERGGQEREEKREALMRALGSVVGSPTMGSGGFGGRADEDHVWPSQHRAQQHTAPHSTIVSPISATTAEAHTPNAERWRVESLEAESRSQLPVDGGAGGGSQGVGGYDANRGEYQPQQGGPTPTRAAASASLLSILNKPTTNQQVGQQQSFASHASPPTHAQGLSLPQLPPQSQHQLQSHPPLPQQQHFPSSPHHPQYLHSPAQQPQQPFYLPQQQPHFPQQFSAPPPGQFMPMPMGFPGQSIPIGVMSVPFPSHPQFAPPPQFVQGGPPNGFAPPQHGSSQQFAPPHQQQTQNQPFSQQHQQPQMASQQGQGQGRPPMPPQLSVQGSLSPPQAPPPQQHHPNSSQLLGLFNAKPAARVG